jgi:hypothetical protein
VANEAALAEYKTIRSEIEQLNGQIFAMPNGLLKQKDRLAAVSGPSPIPWDRIVIRAGVIDLLRLIGKLHVSGRQDFPLRSQ